MQGVADESVGDAFQTDLLCSARDKTLQVITLLAQKITVGYTEQEAKEQLLQIQTALGALKSWHPPQIRFGANSILPFGKKGQENVSLQADDIFFLDIGPIFEGHEGDVGRTFVLGKDPEMRKCQEDVEKIWNEVRDHWQSHKVTGAKLYDYARERAEAYGWLLSLEKANGHRIADFPHAARNRGSIEEFPGAPVADRWILEIQIRHPKKSFGAFYEDLLR